jgi:hypothetical protein
MNFFGICSAVAQKPTYYARSNNKSLWIPLREVSFSHQILVLAPH